MNAAEALIFYVVLTLASVAVGMSIAAGIQRFATSRRGNTRRRRGLEARG